jgi:hypothetical protein
MSTRCQDVLPSGCRHGQVTPCPAAKCVSKKPAKGKEKEREVIGAWKTGKEKAKKAIIDN